MNTSAMKVTVLSLVLVSPAMVGCRSYNSEAEWQGYRKVDIRGCRLNMLVVGRGSPAVILEGGIFGTISGWEKVQPEVAELTRVVAYDRAGLGLSDPAPAEPRTSAQIARELHTALHKAGVSPRTCSWVPPQADSMCGYSLISFRKRLRGWSWLTLQPKIGMT